jgi:hypothetical protein
LNKKENAPLCGQGVFVSGDVSAPHTANGADRAMTDIDDDLESQESFTDDDSGDETPQQTTERDKVLSAWHAKDSDLCCTALWCSHHGAHEDGTGGASLYEIWERTHKRMDVVIGGRERELYIELKEGIQPRLDRIFTHPAFAPFKADFDAHQKAADDLLRKLARLDSQRRGVSFDAIKKSDRPRFLLPSIIPASGITFAYGPVGHGKSAFWHRLALTVASEDALFDGLPVIHGRVLYLSLDPGGDAETVKFERMLPICERFKIKQPGPDRLIIVDSVGTHLDRDEKVSELLAKNPGPFAMLVVDSLYRALSGGDPVQPSQVNPAIDGMMRIAEETGATVCISAHPRRNDDKHLLGTIFQDAGASAIWRVARDRKTDRVTMDCEKMKNADEPDKARIYKLEKSCLVSMNDVADLLPPTETVTRSDMLALVPTEPTPIRDALKLVEHLLRNPPGRAREQEWLRIRNAWEKAGVVKQADGKIWRLQ